MTSIAPPDALKFGTFIYMTVLKAIIWKIYEFEKKSWGDKPKRIILGWEDYKDFITSQDCTIFQRPVKNEEGEYIMGMKVTKSKRPRFIRILPEKMKYFPKPVKFHTAYKMAWSRSCDNLMFPPKLLKKVKIV